MVLKVRMETNDERRKRRLKMLCDSSGGVRAVAETAGIGWEGLDQILKGTPLPAKQDGTRSSRALGDPAARAIEAAFDLGTGWFDWPFDAVDFKQYAALTPVQKGVVQARMQDAIDQFAKPPAVKPEELFQPATGRKPLVHRRKA